jgi:hypothetical protein
LDKTKVATVSALKVLTGAVAPVVVVKLPPLIGTLAHLAAGWQVPA